MHCAIRTLLNGWPDRHRLHVEVDGHSQCLFGCAVGRDSLQEHYFLHCPNFHHLLLEAWSHRVSPVAFSECWAVRSRLDVIASAYTLYVTVSRAHRDGRVANLPDAALAARAQHAVH